MGEVPAIVSNFNSQGCFAQGEGDGIPCLRAVLWCMAVLWCSKTWAVKVEDEKTEEPRE